MRDICRRLSTYIIMRFLQSTAGLAAVVTSMSSVSRWHFREMGAIYTRERLG